MSRGVLLIRSSDFLNPLQAPEFCGAHSVVMGPVMVPVPANGPARRVDFRSRRSSVVEQGPFKPGVVRSSRTGGTSKRCPRCEQTLPVAEFYRDKGSADGRSSKCAPCMRAYNRDYRRKNNTAPIGPDYVVDKETGCWDWQKALDSDGYGTMVWKGRKLSAHRWFYLQHVGPVTDETLDHLCCNKKCVNPAHLEPCSFGENARRRWEREWEQEWSA